MERTSWFQIHRTGPTMVVRLLTLSLLILASSFVYAADTQFGLLKLDGAGHAVLIVAKPLEGAQRIHFQYPGAHEKVACCKRLKAEDFVLATQAELTATNEITGGDVLVYRTRIPKLWAQTPFVGSAAIGQSLITRQRQGHLIAANSGDSSRAVTCVSQEGVHLIEEKNAIKQTHLYLALGYSVEKPDCRF